MEQFLFFSIQGVRCGIPVNETISMIRMVYITPRPGNLTLEAGTINLHGEILPVYSLRKLFGFPDQPPLLSDNLIMVKKGEQMIALWVDETDIVKEKEFFQITNPRPEHRSTIPGIRVIQPDLVIIHDIFAFIAFGKETDRPLTGLMKAEGITGSGDASVVGEQIRDYAAIERVLVERARGLALPVGGTEKKSLIEIIRFNLIYQEFAIETKYIREVIQTSEITPVPGTPDFIAGICSIRGEIISLVDLSILLSIPDKGLTDLNRVIVLHDGHMTFGILADQITGIGTIETDKITPPDSDLKPAWRQYLRGTVNSLFVLDAAVILGDKKLVVDDTENA